MNRRTLPPALAQALCALGTCAAAVIGLHPASGSEITMPQWPDELSELLVDAAAGQAAALPDTAGADRPAVEAAAKSAAAELPTFASMAKPMSPARPAARSEPAGPQSAAAGQDDTGAAASAPPAPKTLAAAAATADTVTGERIDTLLETGLIARQSAIAESIIIMERQLRQAELIGKLMALYGPDAPIEMSPGEYRSFGATPAGRRIAAEIEEAELSASIRLLELRAVESALLNTLEPQDSLVIAANEPPPDFAAAHAVHAPPELLEILGINGEFRASLLVDGETIWARPGDTLPDGSTLASISGDTVRLRYGQEEEAVTLGR